MLPTYTHMKSFQKMTVKFMHVLIVTLDTRLLFDHLMWIRQQRFGAPAVKNYLPIDQEKTNLNYYLI